MRNLKYKADVFGVKHFAGSVFYTVDNFVEKNKNSLNSFLFSYFSQSTNFVLKNIFI